MLAVVGAASLDELIDRVVPARDPHRAGRCDLPPARTEAEALAALRAMAAAQPRRHLADRHGLLRHPHARR